MLRHLAFLLVLFSTTAAYSAIRNAPSSDRAVTPPGQTAETGDDEDDDEEEAPGVNVATNERTGIVSDGTVDGSLEESGSGSKFGDTSANIGIVSDYISRGQTQTAHRPAIQGGIDWEHATGIFVGAWGSNVRPMEVIDEEAAHLPATIELDVYAGYRYQFTRWLSASLAVNRTMYFRSGAGDGWGFPLKVALGRFTAEAIYGTSWGTFGGKTWYLNAGWSDRPFWRVKLAATVGYMIYPREAELRDTFDVRLAISREFFGIDWEIFGTAVGHRQFDGADDSRIGFAISKSL